MNAFTQFENMLQEEAERVADVYLSGKGDSKINTYPFVAFFEADSFDVYNEIAKRVLSILESEGFNTTFQNSDWDDWEDD